MLKGLFNKLSEKTPFSNKYATDKTINEDIGGKDRAEDNASAQAMASGLLKKFKNGLQKSRKGFINQVDALIFRKRKIDDELLEELEELLVTGDISVSCVTEIFERLKKEIKRNAISDGDALKEALKSIILEMVDIDAPPIPWAPSPYICLMAGVNGVGKTTTIAKLANILKSQGKNPLFVASDTFRAAAIDQLLVWGKRLNIPVIHHQQGADPSAVAYDGIEAAIKRGVDVVFVDTAGRLHTKVNLMEELKKIRRVIKKHIEDAPHETLLVLDATNGQNALNQARQFNEATPISGIILTKLDGTAKGGIVVTIANELKIPIRYIGIGEKMDDLEPFSPKLFVDALFSS